MPVIKLHLDDAEYDAVIRYAESLSTKPEAIAYSALNRLMLSAKDPAVRADIVATWEGRAANLPLWADSARSVHAYEGKQDDEPEQSRYI